MVLFLEGISKVKCAPVKAFQSVSIRNRRSRQLNSDNEDDSISMPALETVVDSLLEIMEVIFCFLHHYAPPHLLLFEITQCL